MKARSTKESLSLAATAVVASLSWLLLLVVAPLATTV